ncbi:MAG TPA: condensation domain-containing protein, partial [Pyrinomonadaceae bacterium]
MSWKSGSPAERRARLSALLRERGAGGTAPLSPAQERLWFLEQLDPGQPTYHIPTVLRFDGLVDEEALGRAIAELARRHEALRTVYELDGATPRQRVLPQADVPFEVFDLTGGGPDAEAEAVGLIAEDARRSFDLERGPLVRASLYRLAQHRRLLLLTIHHIAADGWSLVLLMRELGALYPAFARGEQSPLKDSPPQYRDYVRWLEGVLQGASLARLKTFWRTELDGAPTQVEIPADFAPPAVTTHRGNIHRFEVEPVATDALRALGRQEDATLYMGLLALYATLLHRLGGQRDLVIGSPVAHRPRVEMEGVVGLCANVLPMRLDLSGDPSFRDLLRRTREVVYRALQHQELPFERMVEELRPSRRLGRNPIFQVLFTLQNLPRGRPAARSQPAQSLPPVVGTGRAQFDLSFSANEVDGGLVCSFEYSTELFTRATGERMAAQLCMMLRAAAAEPDARLSRLPLLSGAERTRVLASACRDAPSPAPASPETLIAERARTRPDDAAIVSPAGTLTFARLEREVASLSRRLHKLGVGPEVCVGASVAGARDAVVALLATLRAGGAYVPVDPQLPDQRAALILASTRASILLTTSALEERWRGTGAPRLLLLDSPAGYETEDEPG